MASSVEFTSELYFVLMTEIKVRLGEIDRLLTSVGTDVSRAPRTILDLESSYLQTRLVCESVALASLLAHHSTGTTSKLEKSWNADRIFGDLSKINAACFPKAMIGVRTGENNVHFTELEPPGMDVRSLTDIYHKCDHALHRGSIRPLLKNQGRRHDAEELRSWLDAFTRLLRCHSIVVPYLRKAMVIQLWGDEEGNITLAEARSDGEFVLSL